MQASFILLALLGAICLPVCGGGDRPSAAEGTDLVVDMYDNRFEYEEITIPVGGTITWVGAGRNPHNAVAGDDSWSTETVFGNLDQFDGDEAKLTYNAAGSFIFFCTYHGNADGDGMAGTLRVEELS